MRKVISTLVQLAGVAFLAKAGYGVDTSLGDAVIGVGLFVVGLVAERN